MDGEYVELAAVDLSCVVVKAVENGLELHLVHVIIIIGYRFYTQPLSRT